MVNGVQSVIMVGLILMLKLFASNWDKVHFVSIDMTLLYNNFYDISVLL